MLFQSSVHLNEHEQNTCVRCRAILRPNWLAWYNWLELNWTRCRDVQGNSMADPFCPLIPLLTFSSDYCRVKQNPAARGQWKEVLPAILMTNFSHTHIHLRRCGAESNRSLLTMAVVVEGWGGHPTRYVQAPGTISGVSAGWLRVARVPSPCPVQGELDTERLLVSPEAHLWLISPRLELAISPMHKAANCPICL